MKRWVLYSALALLVGAGVLRLLQFDTGYVLIVFAGKSIEMRFWAALFVFSLTLFGGYWTLRRLVRLIRFARGGWTSLLGDRSLRVQHRMEHGVLKLLEGDFLAAEQALAKVVRERQGNVLAFVAHTHAALQLKHFDAARKTLQKGDQFSGEKQLSIAIAQAKLLFAEGRLQDALSRLLVLKTQSPKHPGVLSLLHSVLVEMKDWPALEALLSELDRSDVLADDAWHTLQKLTFSQLLLAAGHAQDPLAELDAIWLRLPKILKSDAELLAIYCRLMIHLQQHHPIETLLKHTLKQQWREDLVEIYGLAEFVDAKQQLHTAEQWLRDYPENPTLLLALGRISLRNQLWGKAREYFTASLKRAPVPAAYAELGRLLERLGEQQQSIEIYRQGLLQSAPDLPSLPLPKL